MQMTTEQLRLAVKGTSFLRSKYAQFDLTITCAVTDSGQLHFYLREEPNSTPFLRRAECTVEHRKDYDVLVYEMFDMEGRHVCCDAVRDDKTNR